MTDELTSWPLRIEQDGVGLWHVAGTREPPQYAVDEKLEQLWREGQRQMPMLNTIITGDARHLAEQIPDCSVDMVFCDPVYDRIEDYAWLAETAARVLKPDRACLVWCSSIKQYEVQPVMRQYLNFVLQLTYTKVAKAYKVWGYKTFLWTTPCLWFQKGGDHFHKDHGWLIDTIIDHSNAIISTSTPPTNSYKWHKNPEAYVSWQKAFTKPGGVVYDPFCGSGSLPIECKRLGRNFIASEIQPDIVEMARARVATVQVIDQVFEPEQIPMFE